MKNIIKNLTVLVLFLPTLLAAQKAGREIDFKKIIRSEIKKHPLMEIQDFYKFIHQAAMGSEHAIKDTNSARKWMDDEISNLDWNHSENLIDTLSPGGKIVRVNIRPYLKAGYNPGKLLTAFVNTANNFKGSSDILKEYIAFVLGMIDGGEINISKSEAEKYFGDLKEKNYPAVHHSKIYEENYSPAYRVVAGEYISFLKKD